MGDRKITEHVLAGMAGDVIKKLIVDSEANPNLRIALFEEHRPASVDINTIDSMSTGLAGLLTRSLGYTFNETTLDRLRGNTETTVEASSAKTATADGTTQTNYNAKGVSIFVDVTAVTGTNPTLDVDIEIKGSLTTSWLKIFDIVQATTTVLNVLQIYPDIAETVAVATHEIQALALPRTWRASWDIGGTDTPTFTFSITASYIL